VSQEPLSLSRTRRLATYNAKGEKTAAAGQLKLQAEAARVKVGNYVTPA
jgi:hypothetical protein